MAEYQFSYTGAQMNTLFGKIAPMEAKVPLFFTNINVPVTEWESNATYAQYPYRAAVPLANVTANHYVEVVFSLADATSGYFAPVCQSYAGGVYIYASAIPVANLTIPTIKATKAN